MNENNIDNDLEIHAVNNVRISDSIPKAPCDYPKSFASLTGDASKKLRNYLPKNQSSRSIDLLIWSAQQLDSARFGINILQRLRSGEEGFLDQLKDSHQTIEIAAANLVSRCSFTSLDLCASSLYWILENEPLSNGYEAGIAYWKEKRINHNKVPLHFKKWLLDLNNSEQFKKLKKCRDQFTHRSVRRDVTIMIGGIPGTGPSTINIDDVHHDSVELLSSFVDFSAEQFKNFCDAIVMTSYE